MRQSEIWEVLQVHLGTEWRHLSEVYEMVGKEVAGEDAMKWKRNVRNVLQRRRASGEVEWDGKGRYRLALG